MGLGLGLGVVISSVWEGGVAVEVVVRLQKGCQFNEREDVSAVREGGRGGRGFGGRYECLWKWQ